MHTVHEAITQYLTSLQPHFSTPTVLAYGQALRLFSQVLSNDLSLDAKKVSVGDIQPDWAFTYLKYLQQHHSIETEHLYSRAILGLYQYLDTLPTNESSDLSSSISAHLAQYRRVKHYQTPTVPLQAIETIIAHVITAPTTCKSNTTAERDTLRFLRDRAFLLTLAYTGLRVSEICSLRLANIDIETSAVLLSADFRFPLPHPIITAIEVYLTQRKSLDDSQNLVHNSHLPLFARHDKKAANRILPISRWTAANIVDFWATTALSPDIRDHLRQSGTPISPQTFRHYFVVTTLQRTGDLQQTQALARHVDTTTTRRYLHSNPPSITRSSSD